MTPDQLYGWFPGGQMTGVLDESGAMGGAGQRGAMSNIAFDLANQQAQPAGVLGQVPQGALSQAAYNLAGSPRSAPPAGAGMGGFLGAMPGGGDSDPTENGKFGGAASGAAAGSNFGPWGALIGAGVGYTLEGGYKDANPLDAGGFTGIDMGQAWQDQNLLRLGSNPAAALANKAGISSSSILGKALDPTAVLGGLFRSKHGDEKRNLNAFLKETTVTEAGDGKYKLPDGALLTKDQLQNLAGAWYGATYHPDGDQAGWQDKYNELLQEIYSQPMYFGG